MKNFKQLFANLNFFGHRQSQPEIVRIAESEMRLRFNQGDYQARLLQGALKADVSSRHVPNEQDLPKNCKYCTTSQRHRLIDAATRELVAVLHCYERPDGSIGASGLKDPKFLKEGAIAYRLIQKRERKPATRKRSPVVKFLHKWCWKWPRYQWTQARKAIWR